MKERKHYISLRLKGGNAFYQDGTRLKLTERIINIGETADCDVHYEANGLQPEYYASIIRNDDGKSWRIVRRSQHVDISIEGKGVIGYAYVLADGDHIQFGQEPMTLLFHQHYDNLFDEERQHNTWQWVAVGLFGLLAAFAILLLLRIGHKETVISAKDVEPLEESIYVLKVDSVRQVLLTTGKEDVLTPTKVLKDDVPTGTAFLTDEGKMITARHCVEYWLGTNLDLTTKVKDMDEGDIVRWAIETETFNQTHDEDSVRQLQVYFSLFDFKGNRKHSFSSTDAQVHINRDRDGVFLLADFSQDYYWRSIRPYFNDRQMELGDILWIDGLQEKGKIRLANSAELKKVKNGTPLMICGYPLTGIGDKRMTFTEGTIRRNATIDTEDLFFESNINHGFSGGPVLMKTDDEVVAIGVVSSVDSISSGLYKWAVPVSEVICEK